MADGTQLMTEADIARSLTRMTHELLERNHGAQDLCLLGVKRRGVPLAQALAANIKRFEGVDVALGTLDTTRYRDDMTEAEKARMAEECTIPVPLEDQTVVIVDDVLFTGRTARAALAAEFAAGRPRAVQLAVLVDRGHRELPIRADYVGKNIPTSRLETVDVLLADIDGETGVFVRQGEEHAAGAGATDSLSVAHSSALSPAPREA